MYDYQYLVSGALSLSVSIYVLLERPRTLALKSLGLFGLVVSLWEISVFLGGGASDAIMATNMFKIMILTSHLCFPLCLVTVLNIREKRSRRTLLLILVPAIIQIALICQNYFDSYEIFQTESGWAWVVVSFQPPLIVVGTILVGYMMGIVFVLFDLSRKTKMPLLKRKYTILLVSFTLFQVIGTTLTNALLAFGLLNPNHRVGGVLQFLTFLSIWYALTLKEEKIPSFFKKNRQFSQIYSSFLTVFYNSVISGTLGEDAFTFTDFIRKSGTENLVSIAPDKITFKVSDHPDLVELINRNLQILDKHSLDEYVVDSYLRVLNAADRKLGLTFKLLVKANEDFLKRSDLLYGVSDGKFLEEIAEDESLKELDDIGACLKIYKRALLPVIRSIPSDEFRDKLKEHDIANAMRITDYGEISTKRARDPILKKPKDQRLPLTIKSFNSVLTWVYARLLTDSSIDNEEMLRRLRLVLTLNKSRAIDLGLYSTLLSALATKIPQAQIQRLYADSLEELVEKRTKDLKEAQENLLKSQRLATIGEAAAMVGHDLRNPLQTIVNTLYLTEKELAPSGEQTLKQRLQVIASQVKYMNKIVSDLQDYASPLEVERSPTDIHRLINETLSTITAPEGVSIVFMSDPDLPVLMIDPTLMKRVFINLITNALQAMPCGGQLTIKATGTGEYAVVSFQDTGVGIPEESLKKLFQPLFTSKAKGQGLGLAVCKRLVEAMGGVITVKSKVGIGTMFKVVLWHTNRKKEPASQESRRETTYSAKIRAFGSQTS